MTTRAVLINPDESLRIPSREVSIEELKSEKIQTLINDLLDTIVVENGVGIAAPQIGAHHRIIIVDDGQGVEVYINPKITARSFRKGHFVEEGCLSIPGVWGFVTRNKAIKVKALNRHGEIVTLRAQGLVAVVFQHEIDHLDGILFIDKVDKYTRHPMM